MSNGPDILGSFSGVRRVGDGWAALCPAHDDRMPSLSICERDGRILINCHAGCTAEAVCKAAGIEMSDLFSDNGRSIKPAKKVAKTIVATYDYRDEKGTLLFQVCRFDPKAFSQRRPDGQGGWIHNLDGVPRVVYRLSEVNHAPQVLVLEGEKDVETARSLGFVGTCNPGGAGKWRPEFVDKLAGKEIIIIPDADEPGRKHGQQVAVSLAGKVQSLKLTELSGAKDLSEWVELGGTREQLLQLIATSPEWAPPDGATLLRKVEEFIHRYLILPPHALLPLALWIFATHCFEVFDAFAYLTVTSPTPRCGKTRLLEVIELIVKDPLRATNASEAALFRGIEKFQPTLLLDEAETLSSKGERADYLRAMVNAGNRRGAHVLRCDGKPPIPEKFNVFCPKVIALIGAPPTTVLDRSIVISMQRRKPGEQVARFLTRIASPEGARLQQAAGSWCESRRSDITRSYEAQPLDFLSDRDAEGWQPLFSILAVADRVRLPELRSCAEVLSGSKAAAAEDDSLSLRLLADIRRIFESSGADRLSSEEIVERLSQDETAPWVEFDRGKPLTQTGLARMLKKFAVSPRGIRLPDGSTPRGYLDEQFSEPWARYLTPPSGIAHQVQQAQQPNNDGRSEALFDMQRDLPVADEKTFSEPHEQWAVARVADKSQEEDGHDSFQGGKGKSMPTNRYYQSPSPASTDDKDARTERDPLYQDAVELSVKLGEVSVSALRRRLGIDTGHAIHLIDAMELAGVVGPADGTGPRQVLKQRAASSSYHPEPLPGGGWRCECGWVGDDPIEWSRHTGVGGCPLLKVRE